ncbi:MAG: glycosyltransferase family 2 protein [Desulfovibrio sp.]|jgi:glycosyltransferase involved in cell wall biosynthesis|nr:glycosyltransferase family 2 protein [Desulfovibrio sp.]
MRTEGRAPVCAIILPCYNEEAVLPATLSAMDGLLRDMVREGLVAPESFALYVDDGSTDATWSLIAAARTEKGRPRVRGLKLAGNAGHQNALLAGMEMAAEAADCAVTIDADLQDDIAAIPEMIRHFQAGSHVVYGVRADRKADSWFKRTSASLFYALMRLLGAPLVPGHADFRLVSRFALKALEDYPERDLFLRSVFPAMRLRSSAVRYALKAREAGQTKYTLLKMVSFAVRGIALHSSAPLRLSGCLGLFSFFLAVLLTCSTLMAWSAGSVIPGWTSLALIILYLGAIQLFCLAVLGEYVAKIFTEVKGRPRYIAEEKLE